MEIKELLPTLELSIRKKSFWQRKKYKIIKSYYNNKNHEVNKQIFCKNLLRTKSNIFSPKRHKN